MVREAIRKASRLERKTNIPDTDRTAERDRVADWIVEKAADDWKDWTITSVSQAADCSRQHVANVLDLYFVPAGESRSASNLGEIGSMSAEKVEELLGKYTEREFLILTTGYRLGYQDALEDEASDTGEIA